MTTTEDIDKAIDALPLDDQAPSDSTAPDDSDKTPAEPADPWHGKSREEVIAAYNEQQAKLSTIQQKQEQAQEPPTPEEEEIEFELGLSEEDFENKKPQEIWAHVANKVAEHTANVVKRENSKRATRQQQINSDLAKAASEYPRLKTEARFKNLFRTIIRGQVGMGEQPDVMKACKEAQEILGDPQPAPKKDQSKNQQPKVADQIPGSGTDVDTGGGAPRGKAKVDPEEALVARISTSKNNVLNDLF